MKKLWLFGIIVLLIIGIGAFSIQYANAGKGSGWPGHHGGRCFIETASGNNNVENETDTPTQSGTDEDVLAYRSGGYGGYGHGGYSGGYYGGHNSHHHGHHDYCFMSVASGDSWFDKILDFIWRPRS